MTDKDDAHVTKLIEEAQKKPPIPWAEFALSGVDWDEWPGGASEILSAYETRKERLEALRDKWAQLAADLETLHGSNPISNALRICISDTHDLTRG
jgi:hypothetical protein